MGNPLQSTVRKIKGQQTVSGGEIVARILAEEGVDHVFGIIDGTYFGFYKNLEPNGVRLITPRHETSAVHMAGAYARVTGKLGVCMASNGPGVANALPGVAVEQAEGNRVLLITSSRREGIAYPDRGGAFQFFPAVQAIGAMAKRAIAVPSADRVAAYRSGRSASTSLSSITSRRSQPSLRMAKLASAPVMMPPAWASKAMPASGLASICHSSQPNQKGNSHNAGTRT